MVFTKEKRIPLLNAQKQTEDSEKKESEPLTGIQSVERAPGLERRHKHHAICLLSTTRVGNTPIKANCTQGNVNFG